MACGLDNLKNHANIQPADARSRSLAGCTEKQRADARKGTDNEHERENRNDAG